MEPEDKKTKRTSSTKGASTARKVNSTKATATEKTVATKKAESTVTKSTAQKASSNKEAPKKKASSTKSASVKKTTTAKNTEATRAKSTANKASTGKQTATRKVASTQKTPTKKNNVEELIKPDKDEEVILDDAVAEKEEVNKEQELKEQANKNQEKKKNKRYIEISIGAIICAIIIIALIILNIKLGKHAYGILKNEPTSSNTEPEEDVSVTQEIGNVLNKTNELVEKMKGNITFPSNVTASIYNTQGFNSTTIPNGLKLILGWAKSEEGSKLKSVNEKNEEVEALEDDVMSETIKNILGSNIQYTDESFDYTKIDTFASSSKNQETINYSDRLYTSILASEVEEGLQPLIYQEIQKVVKYSEKVVVHVKVAFIDVEGNNYQVYKNFKNNKFSERLLLIEPDKLFEGVSFNQYTGEGTVTAEKNSALDSVREKLDTYKYTFTLDETTQEYYLSEFGKDNV